MKNYSNSTDMPRLIAAFTPENRQILVFLMPLLIFVIGFILVPVLATLVNSLFVDVTYVPKKFIGFANYRWLFGDPEFWQSLRFTALFVLVSVPLEVALGLIIALVLNESLPLRGLIRAAVLIPWAIPAVVSGRIFELIYNYSYGAANELLMALNLSSAPVNWLGTEMGAFFALVLADTWKTTPFAAIILLAGLAAVPGDLYRQARVDRATIVQQFFKITLPLLKPVLIVTFLFRTIDALRIFDIIFVLTGGGPGGATLSLSLFGYRFFSSGDFGYGSSVSVILFIMAFVLAMGLIRLGRMGQVIE
jgi:multiple sugar transport system permease protein